MRKWFILLSLICMTLMFSGCSLLPRITWDKAGVTPTQTEKSLKQESCAGAYQVSEAGDIVACERGYKNYEQNFKQVEREYTWKEKILNFFRNLIGIWFWVVIAVIFLFPGVIGWLIGGTFNAAKTALTSTVKAISNFKSSIPKVVVNGVEVEDPAYVKAVDNLLDALEVQHSQDVEVMKTIAKIRLQLKIKDED